jgi:protoheme IX farnesyltransferase
MRSALYQLTKVGISATSTATALAVYLLARGRVDLGLLWLFLGVFLLACGACALNEVQEWRLDAQMERTSRRPIPSGRISPRQALALAVGLLESGFLALLFGANLGAAILGLAAVAWYNGLYTPLKRVTAFAVVPGAVIGALPPAIGWVAAGQSLFDPRCAALCFFFFVWQIPHFWLLVARHGQDYAKAGFPTLLALFDRDRLGRLTYTWIAATAASCLLLPLYGVVTAAPLFGLLTLAAAWLVGSTSGLVRAQGELLPFRRAFLTINLFALVVMVALVGEPLLGGRRARTGSEAGPAGASRAAPVASAASATPTIAAR